MSCLLMRPPAPVPGTEPRSMPCSLAMRRTSGELWMRSPAGRDDAGPGPEAAATGAGAAGFAAWGGGTICGFATGAGAGTVTGFDNSDDGLNRHGLAFADFDLFQNAGGG